MRSNVQIEKIEPYKLFHIVKHRLDNIQESDDDNEVGWNLIGHCFLFLYDQLNEKKTFEWKISGMKELVDQSILPAATVLDEYENQDDLNEDGILFTEVLRQFLNMHTDYLRATKRLH